MKKLVIILTVVVVAIYFVFIHGGPLKSGFNFNGETYVYAKNMYGGAIKNYFYTPNGDDFNTATAFVQVLKFDDKIQKKDWITNLKPLFNRYHLKPFEEDPFELAGRTHMAGFFYKSYAAPISVDGKEYMAVFITGSTEKQNEDSDSEIFDIINELKNIRFE